MCQDLHSGPLHAMINEPEEFNFSLITWRVSNASLKESVHPDLEGRCTENMMVLLSMEIPMQRWLASIGRVHTSGMEVWM